MMTDEQIDSLIDRLKPDLRQAIRDMLNGAPIHMFNIDGLFGGKRVPYTVFITNHYAGAVLEWTAKGLAESNARLVRDFPQLQAFNIDKKVTD
jgi:hypothetical protein